MLQKKKRKPTNQNDAQQSHIAKERIFQQVRNDTSRTIITIE